MISAEDAENKVISMGYSMLAISGLLKLLSEQNDSVSLDGDICNGMAYIARLAAKSISELSEDKKRFLRTVEGFRCWLAWMTFAPLS